MTAHRATLCANLSILTFTAALTCALFFGQTYAHAQTTATTATTATTLTTTPPTTATTATTNPSQVINTGNVVNIVGGVMVNVDGVLAKQDDRQRAEVLAKRRQAMQAVAGDLNQPTKLRMISL